MGKERMDSMRTTALQATSRGVRGWWVAVGGALVLAGGGCSGRPAEYEITGAVRYKGQPVTEGSILFAGEDGGHATAGGDVEQGTYRLQAPAGTYRIVITTPPPPMMPGPPPPDLGIPPEVVKKMTEEARAAAKKKRVTLPGTYSQFSSTPLRYTVVKGNQSHDIEID
jgi:hypothetical protein